MIRNFYEEPIWQCLNCSTPLGRPLGGRAWQCKQCHTRYFLHGLIPILVKNPLEYRARTVLSIRRYCERAQDLIQRIIEDAAQTENCQRASMLKLAEEGLKSNVRLAQAQLNRLQESFRGYRSSGSSEVREPAATRNYGLHNLSYLKTDWAGTSSGERQVQLVLKHILPQLARHSPGGTARAVVLGAATGRYAVECAKHCCLVIAVELCYSYVDLFLELQKGPISFWELNFGRPVSIRSMVREYVASLPPDSVLLSRVHYAIADATALPVPSESQSTALSVYFMDVLPIRTLLMEVRRVLQPGGIFIHFGPLHYHYNTLSQLLAPEEVLELAEECGFALVEEKWMQMSFFRDENRGAYAVHRVWNLVLRRR